ncbi:MAG: SufD family Fe-S cluster assembly protein [Planctomycetota bacterium]|mgnify:FL=1
MIDAPGYALADCEAAARTHRGPGWLSRLRREATDAFARLGFPGRAEEGWRFLDASAVALVGFRPAPARGSREAPAGIPDFGGPRLVFSDGRLVPGLSTPPPADSGLRVDSLRDVLARSPGAVESVLGRIADVSAKPFAALNAALFSDGALVRAGKGASPIVPVHLAFVSRAGASPRATHPRVLVVADEGSRCLVVETHHVLGEGSVLENAVTELAIGRSARVSHVRISRAPASAFLAACVQAIVGPDGRYESWSLPAAAAFSREDAEARLAAPAASCELRCLLVGTGEERLDAHATIDHATPGGRSRQDYKAVLGGRARAGFDGRIVVRPGADRTDALQSSRGIILSEGAIFQARPRLEIRADDVRCAHGASIGRLDENALFYLTSRGIGASGARRLLLEAFAGSAASGLAEGSVREAFEAAARERLDAALSEGGPS